jgi:hypothetical protein
LPIDLIKFDLDPILNFNLDILSNVPLKIKDKEVIKDEKKT